MKMKLLTLCICCLMVMGCAGLIQTTEDGCKVKGFGAIEGTLEVEGTKCSVKKGLFNWPNLDIR